MPWKFGHFPQDHTLGSPHGHKAIEAKDEVSRLKRVWLARRASGAVLGDDSLRVSTTAVFSGRIRTKLGQFSYYDTFE
jgi:hypothetical protein